MQKYECRQALGSGTFID